MQYDLTSDFQRKAFLSKMEYLLERCAVVELTEKAIRTKGQNNYLHLLLGVVAMETGNTLEYCKEWYFKRLCNKDLFVVLLHDKFLGGVEVVRSTADLTKPELSIAIDRFKRWGYENGIYMPNPGDESLLREISLEMGRCRAYIGG